MFIFEWGEVKAERNLKLVSRRLNRHFTTYHDPDHLKEEHRFIDIGVSDKNRVLVISDTERQGKIRIVSVCKATPA